MSAAQNITEVVADAINEIDRIMCGLDSATSTDIDAVRAQCDRIEQAAKGVGLEVAK